MNFNITDQFDFADSTINGDDEYELPDETLLTINTQDLYQIHENKENVSTNKTNERFSVVSEGDVKNTLKRKTPYNTRSNTAFSMNTLNSWIEFRNMQSETKDDPMGKLLLSFQFLFSFS